MPYITECAKSESQVQNMPYITECAKNKSQVQNAPKGELILLGKTIIIIYNNCEIVEYSYKRGILRERLQQG